MQFSGLAVSLKSGAKGRCSLSDRVDVVIVGCVDLSVVGKRTDCLVEFLLVHALLDHVPNVALVNELVGLGDLLHALENKLLGVAGVRIEARVARRIVTSSAHA